MTREQFIHEISREQEPLRRFLCLLCEGDSFRADDLAQEALLKAYLSFEGFEGRSKFSTWLFRIAYNCFYDSKSRNRSDDVPIESACEKIDDDTGSDKCFSNEALYLAIEGLSDQEKAVTLLFYMEDKSIKDIESITGMPSGTIRSHLSRARGHLKTYLEKQSDYDR